jgi:hypothetical protein
MGGFWADDQILLTFGACKGETKREQLFCNEVRRQYACSAA